MTDIDKIYIVEKNADAGNHAYAKNAVMTMDWPMNKVEKRLISPSASSSPPQQPAPEDCRRP